MGCHFLLQGTFLTQGSNLSPLHCRWIIYRWATREVHYVYIYPCFFFWFPSHLGYHRALSRVLCAISQFSLVIYFMLSINSVYMSIPVSWFLPLLLPLLVKPVPLNGFHIRNSLALFQHPPAFPSSQLSPQAHALSWLFQASNVGIREKDKSTNQSQLLYVSLQVPLTTSSTWIYQELGDFNKGSKKSNHLILELQALQQLVRGDIWGQKK